jgi:hypothetical protein
VVVGNFNNPLSPIDRSSKQKLNKEILELNDTINQMDLNAGYRIFHLTTHNIHTSQQHMKFSPKQIIFYDIKQVTTNIRK